MKKTAVSVLVLMTLVCASVVWAASAGPGISAEEALKKLRLGNERFVSGKVKHPHADKKRMALTAEKGQAPFASILSCSDSRAPVELLFDQGVGDVFVIRVAGNVADVDEAATIEYGVDHLNTPLLVVLGHTKCGAVTAVAKGAHLPQNLAMLVDNIIPAVEKVKKENPQLKDDDLVNAAIKANVWQAVEDVFKNSPGTKKKVRDGKVLVVGAIYDIHSGKIDWLGRHPRELDLLN